MIPTKHIILLPMTSNSSQRGIQPLQQLFPYRSNAVPDETTPFPRILQFEENGGR